MLILDIRSVQLKQLELLKELSTFCDVNNIQFFLIGGTAIGAVRHKGFIPWDDDIDIGMLRADYTKFLELYKNESNNKFFLQTNETDIAYPMLFAKLRYNGTTFIEPGTEKIGSRMHQGIFIDIFPLDYISSNNVLSKMHYYLISLFISIASTYGGNYPKSKIKRVAKYLYSKAFIFVLGKKGLEKLAHKVATLKTRKKTNCIINFFGRHGLKEMVEIDIFGEGNEMEFEGSSYPLPKRYNDYLTKIYGDYMKLPPMEERETHKPLKVSIKKDYKQYFKE